MCHRRACERLRISELKNAQHLPLIALVLFHLNSLHAQSRVDTTLFRNFKYRNLGPFRAGAWISDIAVPENPDSANRFTFYVAARNGGVWKTSNNGTTFKPIFDHYGTNSIGAVEVAPSDPNIIWVGTGESYNVRNTTPGNGIYKSTDGGVRFTCMGLRDSHHIARIHIHPGDVNTVYAAVMGHLFSNNEERGVFKTTDGGMTWKKVLYINDAVGVIDLVMSRRDPDVLYAAAYDKVRYPWHYEAGGPGSAVYRTKDGGANWTRLQGDLPEGNIGRIGIDVFRRNPDIVYAVVENLNPKPARVTQDEESEFDPLRDPYFDRLVGGEVYRSSDGGDTWTKMNADSVNVSGKAAYSFNQIWVDPNDSNNLFINSIAMCTSHDAGRTWHDVDWPPGHRFASMFGDIRTFWIDHRDSRHMMIGSDGGLYATWDEGRTTYLHYHIPLGEVYDVEVDFEDPYRVYAGLQDHETWRGPVNSWSGAVTLEDWVITGKWDGMVTAVDPEDNRWAYCTTQFGSHLRVDQVNGERVDIMPRAADGATPYRYTWQTPIVLSPHNSRILYTGGQMLLRSLDRGGRWEELSSDLTHNDSVKIAGRGHLMYCTITAIAESPLLPGNIWVGTDDGRLHRTGNHGATWEEHTSGLSGLGAPEEIRINYIFASHHEPATVYVVKSGLRWDDAKPYVFRTTDFGTSWEDISADLPQGAVSLIWEDHKNPNLLFAGSEAGVFVSLDGGEKWFRFKQNMPDVPVRDLLVHPRENDLVLATYGRGVWITDISPLQQLNPDVLDDDWHLFDIEPKPQRNTSQQASWGNYALMGDNQLATPNEPDGLVIYYYVKESLRKPCKIMVQDIDGNEISAFEGESERGLHRQLWNTRRVKPGLYRVILQAGRHRMEKKAEVRERTRWPVGNQAK